MPDYSRMDLSVNYWYKNNNGFNFSIYNVFMNVNPVYVFLVVRSPDQSGNLKTEIRQKRMLTIVPSISWNFKF